MATRNDSEADHPSPDAAAPSAPPSPMTVVVVVVAVATLSLEAAIGLAALRGTVAIGWLLLGHLAVVGALVAWTRRHLAAGHEASAPLVLLLLTFTAGPVGALGALLTLPFLRRSADRSPLLDAWYERISMSTSVDAEAKLADSILSGRTLEVGAPPPARLDGIMQRGSLAERQKALGLIARRFDPTYSAALQAALKSPEPVVRVQAAAVAARVRGTLKAEVRDLLARLADIERDAKRAADAAARLEGFARSGLLDEGDRLRAEAAVERLRGAMLAYAAARDRRASAEPVAADGTRTAALGGAGPAIVRLPASLAAAREMERALISAGRFRDLRVARSVDALARRGFSVRPRRQAGPGTSRARGETAAQEAAP